MRGGAKGGHAEIEIRLFLFVSHYIFSPILYKVLLCIYRNCKTPSSLLSLKWYENKILYWDENVIELKNLCHLKFEPKKN